MNTVIQVLNNKDGKDKTMKLIQYTCKLLLHFRLRSHAAANLASTLSSFRAIMRMGNWLECGYNLRACHKMRFKTVMVESLGLATAICDDIIVCNKMGMITNKRLVQVAVRQAAVTWFLSILINIRDAHKTYQKSPSSVTAASVGKLACDGMFCAVDVFDIPSNLLPILSGLGSAILAYYKLYVKFSSL